MRTKKPSKVGYFSKMKKISLDVAEIYQLYTKLGVRHILSIRLANSFDSDFESRVKLRQSSLSIVIVR